MSETVRKKGLTGYFLLGPGMLWLLLFFLIPFYSLLAASLFNSGGSDFRGYTMVYEWSNYTEVIKAYWPQIVRSLIYGGIATLQCLLLGYVLAYAIAFKAGRWKNLMLVLVIAPFFTSFLVRTLSWKLILADDGIVVNTLQFLHLAGPERPPALHAVRGRHGPDLQLPAVHGAAALREHRQDRLPPDRGVQRPLRQPGRGLLQGDLPALAAGRHLRHAARRSSPRSATTSTTSCSGRPRPG